MSPQYETERELVFLLCYTRTSAFRWIYPSYHVVLSRSASNACNSFCYSFEYAHLSGDFMRLLKVALVVQGTCVIMEKSTHKLENAVCQLMTGYSYEMIKSLTNTFKTSVAVFFDAKLTFVFITYRIFLSMTSIISVSARGSATNMFIAVHCSRRWSGNVHFDEMECSGPA